MNEKFKEILGKIGEFLTLKSEVSQFEDVKDNQGNIIRIDKFEVGGKAQLISTDGSLIDLADGEYELEDGRKFTVQGGLISNVSVPNPENPNPDKPAEGVQPIKNEGEAAKPVDPTAAPADGGAPATPDMSNYEERVSDLEGQMTEIQTAIEKLMEYVQMMAESTKEFKSVKKQLEKDKEELSKKVGDLEKTPAVDPIEVKARKVANTKENEVKTLATYNSNEHKFYDENIDYAESVRKMRSSR